MSGPRLLARCCLAQKNPKSFVEVCEFLSQIIDYDDVELERLNDYANHLSPLLRINRLEDDDVDISDPSPMHYRLTKQAELTARLDQKTGCRSVVTVPKRLRREAGVRLGPAGPCQRPILGLEWLMRVIALKALKDFWANYPEHRDAEQPTLAWYREVLKADWESPNQLKEQFRNASILKDGRAVFNVAGNKYRIVVWINYSYRIVYIRFIGTHQQYDSIDAQSV